MSTLSELEVLVTGATGFIGSHLTEALVKCGSKVSIICRHLDLTEHPILKTLSEKIHGYRCDLLDTGSLRKCIRRINPKKVYHLAALVTPERTFDTLDKCIQVNIQGTANLLRVLVDTRSDCDSFVHI